MTPKLDHVNITKLRGWLTKLVNYREGENIDVRPKKFNLAAARKKVFCDQRQLIIDYGKRIEFSEIKDV